MASASTLACARSSLSRAVDGGAVEGPSPSGPQSIASAPDTGSTASAASTAFEEEKRGRRGEGEGEKKEREKIDPSRIVRVILAQGPC